MARFVFKQIETYPKERARGRCEQDLGYSAHAEFGIGGSKLFLHTKKFNRRDMTQQLIAFNARRKHALSFYGWRKSFRRMTLCHVLGVLFRDLWQKQAEVTCSIQLSQDLCQHWRSHFAGRGLAPAPLAARIP